VTVELLAPTTPGLRFGSGPRQRAFSPRSDVTPGGDRHQRFTWRTTTGSSTPDRWRDMSIREPRSCNTGQRMKLRWAKSSESGG